MRIVVAEPGLGRVLRDAGHEVIYLGPDHSPEQIAATAIQEDADAIGLTVQDDADRLTALLAELDADDIDVTVFPPDQPRTAR